MGFVGWGSIVAQAVTGVLTFPLEQKITDALEGERVASGRITCALRVHSGTHEGLSALWRPAVATLRPGIIEMSPKLVVRVLEVDRSAPRQPKLWEQYGVDLQSEIIRVRTENAVLEWSVRPKFLDWAAGVVGLPIPR